MSILLWWSVIVGITALVLPPAMYLTMGPTPLALLVILVGLISWCALFARAWYLYEKLALWMLLSLVPLLAWPLFFGFMLVACTYTISCL